MQDKSFEEAIQDLQDRISIHLQEAINHMLLYRTTATNATSYIKDEKMRAAVTDALISGQIIALLTLMKDLQLLDKEQHDEFTQYLLASRRSQFPHMK